MAEQGLMAGQQLPTPKKKKKKVAYITKKKKYTGKKYDTSALAAGQQVLTARKGRKDRGRKNMVLLTLESLEETYVKKLEKVEQNLDLSEKLLNRQELLVKISFYGKENPTIQKLNLN